MDHACHRRRRAWSASSAKTGALTCGRCSRGGVACPTTRRGLEADQTGLLGLVRQMKDPNSGGREYWVKSAQLSAGAGVVLGHVVTPTDDGRWDLTGVHLEVNTEDLRSPLLCNGGRRVALSIDELSRAAAHLGLARPEHSERIGWILLMQNQAQVFWRGGGICIFLDVEERHLDVLRTVRESLSTPDQRRAAGISFTDTILTLADIYRCQGNHMRSCPAEGHREHSMISPTGEVNTTLVSRLRNFGLANDPHQ